MRRLAALYFCCSLLVTFAAGAQRSGQTSSPVIVGRAELLHTLKTKTLRSGDVFFLRTLGSWQEGNCALSTRTTLKGEVTLRTQGTAGDRRTLLAVRFAPVHCAGSQTEFRTPLLVALDLPDEGTAQELKHLETAPAQSAALEGVFTTQAGQRPQVAASTNNAITASYMASVINRLGRVAEPEKPLRTGEVRGYRGLRLELPEDHATTALTARHDFTLEQGTECALLYVAEPTPVKQQVTAPVHHQDEGTPLTRPQQAAVAPEEVCAAAGCVQVVTRAAMEDAQAGWTVPLATLGYQPRPHEQTVGLDDSATVHFLGSNQVVLTFVRHTLVPRDHSESDWRVQPRTVRAVLLDRRNGQVLRMEDWSVPDGTGPFVWGVQGHLLAHLGHELVLLGPGLQRQSRTPLPGPLLFVSADPGGDHVMAATVRERHSEQEHLQIANFLGPGVPVDEDYDVTGYNGDLRLVGATLFSEEPIRPALLRDGLLTVVPHGAKRWTLEARTWAGQTSVLSHVSSGCEVEVESLEAELLLLQGCSATDAAQTWYRVLNRSGATLLKANPSYGEFVQQAQTDAAGKRFAVASSVFDQPVSKRSQLRPEDFRNLTISIYSTISGKAIFALRLPEGSAHRASFALASAGDQVVVLTGNSLKSFVVGPPESGH